MAYVTINELKDYRGIDSGGDDTLLERLIAASERIIKTITQRDFEAQTATKYYRRPSVDGKILYLDDYLLTVSTLLNGDTDATELTSSTYWLLPRNRSPYFAIELKSDYSWEFGTDGEVSVAGTWGQTATAPAEIVQVALRLCAWMYAQRDAPNFETILYPELGTMSIPAGIPADVVTLLETYKPRWR